MSKTLLPEIVVPGRRLGRNVNHDPRSLAYRVGRTAEPKTVRWERRIPILDQGNLGACTGYAAVGVLGTEPFYSTLDFGGNRPNLGDIFARSIYSDATKIDPFDGQWPDDDTGSDGLSVAKVAKSYGMISGYRHITSIGEAHAAVQEGPFIVGTLWMSDMDKPVGGIVKTTGYARGGHEYECVGYNAERDLWAFANSWSDQFGANGYFYYDTPSFTSLLGQQGDATPFTPCNQPAPTPSPEPTRATYPVVEYEAYKAHRFSIKKRAAFISATDAWLGRS